MKHLRNLVFLTLLCAPSLALADVACEKALMGAGAPGLLAQQICTLSPSSITLTSTLTAEQVTSTDDATIGDDLAVGGQLTLDVGTLAAAGTIITDAGDIVDQVTYVTASDNAKGVQLPAATIGQSYDIYNTVASKNLLVWPTASGAINGGSANAAVTIYGKQAMKCVYAASNDWKCGSLGTVTATGVKTIFIPAGLGRVGAGAGWVNTGTNINQATVAASQSAGTFTIPISCLEVGDTIESFKVVGQIESAGGAVTLDADLRQLTNAAADPADASLGAITQVAVTADTAVTTAKTLVTPELIDTGDMPYVLLTATTAASTDIRLLGVEVVVRRQN